MTPLHGLAMDVPLLISSLLENAAASHGNIEIVARDMSDRVHRTTYVQAHRRSKQLAKALIRNGIGLGSRISTLAWNTHRHFELFYGVTGIGAVLHTVNPRLKPEQIVYIINDGGSEILFLDRDMIPLIERVAAQLKNVTTFVVLEGESDIPATSSAAFASYETWLAQEDDDFEWPVFDERSASIICYTSGTTGNPKGVVSSHRSTVLQSMAMSSVGWLPASRGPHPLVLMPLAPMFHSNAWNYPFIAPYIGSKLVLAGRNLQPEKVYELIEAEGVTTIAGVPSLWNILVDWLEANDKRFSRLETMMSAGTNIAPALVARLQATYNVDVCNSWGMTEANAATTGMLKSTQQSLPADQQIAFRSMAGRATPGIKICIVDTNSKPLPHDGRSRGELRVKGPWIAASYLNKPTGSALDAHGWLDTGDIATIDPDGYIRIIDRAKDLIKSGGEWISSVEIEAAALSHGAVLQAAVIAVPHPRWQERPLLVVTKSPGKDVTAAELMTHLRARVAKWWLPDAIEFIDEMPITGTNKIRKVELRARFGDYILPDTEATSAKTG
jgi:acyl-CoA synthetase (AMP-forming)/AMP-acid ligase II